MGKPTGFLEIDRHDRGYDKPEERAEALQRIRRCRCRSRARARRRRAAWIAAFRSATTAVRSTT